MNKHKRQALLDPLAIRKCPSCDAEFRDWEAQYEHARTAVHLVAESCLAQHVQTGEQCAKQTGHLGRHAYVGSTKLIEWGK